SRAIADGLFPVIVRETCPPRTRGVDDPALRGSSTRSRYLRLLDAPPLRDMTTQKSTSLLFAAQATVEVVRPRGHNSRRRVAPPTHGAKERSMDIERKPVAYGDLRDWIKALHAAGEIREIDAEVDWNIEIGTVMRLAQGAGDGPALMFN